MTNEDYPIYAEDGTLFCMRHRREDGEVIVEGPKGKKIKISSLMQQAYDPSVAKTNRGRKKVVNR